MQHTIRASCPSCGPVDLTTDDIVVLTARSAYRFRCSCCGASTASEARPDVIDLLVAVGVRAEASAQPAHRASDPFTEDDVTRLAALLDSPTWVDELRRSLPDA